MNIKDRILLMNRLYDAGLEPLRVACDIQDTPSNNSYTTIPYDIKAPLGEGEFPWYPLEYVIAQIPEQTRVSLPIGFLLDLNFLVIYLETRKSLLNRDSEDS